MNQASLAQPTRFGTYCMGAIMLGLGVQWSVGGGLCPQRAHGLVMKMKKTNS